MKDLKTDFHERLALSTAEEQKRIAWLIERGYVVSLDGQAEAARRTLNGTASLLRWRSDLLVRWPWGGGVDTVMLEIKTVTGRHAGGPNVSVEQASLRSALFYEKLEGNRVLFGWPEGLLAPVEVQGGDFYGAEANAGSGTPYILLPKHLLHPWDEFFPPVPEELRQRAENPYGKHQAEERR